MPLVLVLYEDVRGSSMVMKETGIEAAGFDGAVCLAVLWRPMYSGEDLPSRDRIYISEWLLRDSCWWAAELRRGLGQAAPPG